MTVFRGGRCLAWLLSPKKVNSGSKLQLIRALLSTTTSSITNPTTSSTNESNHHPPPIQVLQTESAGRGVYATRKIGAGELIHTAKPILSHPSLSSFSTVCYLCLRRLPNANKQPSGSEAQSITFCSDDCKREAKAFYEVEKQADWSAYEDYCRCQGLKYPLLVKRLACMVISGVSSPNNLDILQPAKLSLDMTVQMEKELDLLRNTFKFAAFTDEVTSFLTKQWYIDTLARIRINAFRIELVGSYEDFILSAGALVEAEAAVGNAIYLLPSLYNHDCDPNAHILWIENVNARVKALREIETGEELRICYIDASMNRDARQHILSHGYGFQCCCMRCLSDDD